MLLRGHECVGEGDQIKLGVETRLIPVERSLEYLLDAGDPGADQHIGGVLPTIWPGNIRQEELEDVSFTSHRLNPNVQSYLL